jgi:hypothetical protein
MKSKLLRAMVLAFSTAAVALLALSPSEAADSSSSSDPMGACCGQQPSTDTGTDLTKPQDMKCGPGTHLEGRYCVSDTPNAPRQLRTNQNSGSTGGQRTLSGE